MKITNDESAFVISVSVVTLVSERRPSAVDTYGS